MEGRAQAAREEELEEVGDACSRGRLHELYGKGSFIILKMNIFYKGNNVGFSLQTVIAEAVSTARAKCRWLYAKIPKYKSIMSFDMDRH